MYLFDTKMRKWLIGSQLSVRFIKLIKITGLNTFINIGYSEKILFNRYVDDTINIKIKYLLQKSYHFNPKQIFKTTPITNPASSKTNWLGILAIFNIAFSITGFYLFKNK